MKKYLLSAIIVIFLTNCSKEDSYLVKNSLPSSSIENSSLLSGLVKDQATLTPECKFKALTMLMLEKNISFYNHTYQRWLTAESSIAGTWEGASIFIDAWYKGLIWRHAQQWTFVPIIDDKYPPKNGGWTFYLSNKVGAGKTRYMGVSHKYPIDDPNRETLGMGVYSDPHYYNFEFIPVEIRKDCTQPRGVIVSTDTGRMLRVLKNDSISAVLGELYDPNKLSTYDDFYLWEAAPR